MKISCTDERHVSHSYTHFLSISLICQTLLASVEYDYRDISNGEMLGSGAGGDVLKVDLKDKTGFIEDHFNFFLFLIIYFCGNSCRETFPCLWL